MAPGATPGRIARALRARAQARAEARAEAEALKGLDALRGPGQDALVEDLRDAFASLPEDDAGDSPWWTEVRSRLRGHVLESDPRRFLTWNEIKDTMFVSLSAPFVGIERRALTADPAWGARWEPALEEDATGCPVLLPGTRTSANLVHHAYHLLRLEQAGVDPLGMDRIVEFGGGYGSLVRLLRRLGYAGGYHVHDFPELNRLQEYYLRSVAEARDRPEIARGTSFGQDIADVPAVQGDTLFVALWSLSETPVADRAPWTELISRCSHALIAFQHEFEGADNRAWFGRVFADLSSLRWEVAEIPHLPGHSYAFGRPA